MLHADSRHCPPLPPPPPPQIQADLRLIQSKMFASGYSLRFPRIRRIREDKSCREVMTLQELTDMVEENKGNLTGAPAPPDSPFAPPSFPPGAMAWLTQLVGAPSPGTASARYPSAPRPNAAWAASLPRHPSSGKLLYGLSGQW